jgi:hypothetical protein
MIALNKLLNLQTAWKYVCFSENNSCEIAYNCMLYAAPGKMLSRIVNWPSTVVSLNISPVSFLVYSTKYISCFDVTSDFQERNKPWSIARKSRTIGDDGPAQNHKSLYFSELCTY